MIKKQLFIIVIILILLGVFFRVFFKKPIHSNTAPIKLVEVEKVKAQNITKTTRLIGTIHPKHSANLIASGSGTLDVLVRSGQSVKKGQILAKIKNQEIEKQVKLATRAESLAKVQYERLQKLVGKGFVSTKDLEEKEQAWIHTQKEVEQARIELNNLYFYAPFDGIVGAYKKRSGAQIQALEAIVTMYDPNNLVLDIDLPCNKSNIFHNQQPVYVFGKRYQLSNVQNMLDEHTHMCPAEVDIHCKECVLGSTTTADFVISEKKNTLVIPFQAVILKDSTPFVYIAENGKIVQNAVVLGLRHENNVEVIKGLKAGQQLVTKGLGRLYPGISVEVFDINKQQDL